MFIFIDRTPAPCGESLTLKLLLVIPCLRESARLPGFLPGLLGALQPLGSRVEVLTVDDGSGAGEQEWLRNYCEEMRREFPSLRPPLLLPENAGKGGAVYAGWATAGAEVTHLAFVDADGAIPPREAIRLIHLARGVPASACFGIRTGADGTLVERTLGRRIAGLVFRAIVKTLFRFPLPDTQCGFKIVPAAAWRLCRAHLRENRFCFDVELTWHLLRQGTPLLAAPIDWSERPGSRLRPGSVWAMVSSLWTLRQRLGSWRIPAAGAAACP